MKKMLLLASIVFCLAASAQNSTLFKMPAEIKFERTIQQKISGDKNDATVTYYFSASGDYAAMKPEDKSGTALIIYTKEGNMLIVNDKEKSIIIMNLKKFIGDIAKAGKEMAEKKKGEYSSKDSGNVKGNFSKTGRTKTISGYPAEEYEIKSEKGTMLVWYIKTDFDANLIYTMGLGGGIGASSKSAAPAGKDFMNIPGLDKNSFMAEMESNGKKKIETISISKTGFTFSSAGYTVRDMSDLMKGNLN